MRVLDEDIGQVGQGFFVFVEHQLHFGQVLGHHRVDGLPCNVAGQETPLLLELLQRLSNGSPVFFYVYSIT